ncbi:DUF421 domain-containing protein [Paenibacillus alkalitolerans]|uniref:DUF421 domain-containing protein n=1 Tax=Paenibacillus alkalitolerans TaxID=2799335 RepID=UPI0018F4C385|nr:DUF421 domain-containing protein [Paenibacillus alkalitolerans]
MVVGEVMYRTLTAIVVVYILTRLLGKKQLAQLNFFGYITGITIGSIAAELSLAVDEPFMNAATSLGIWFGFALIVELISLRSRKFRTMFDGSGTVLIRNGHVLERNLKSVRLTPDELLEELRQKNAFRLADVEFAVMESSGAISVYKKHDAQPLTPGTASDQNHLPPDRVPEAVIMEGKLIRESMKRVGVTEQWLHQQLEKYGVTQKDVYLAQVDERRNLYLDLYDQRTKEE